jgi:RNA polymerase sigma-70 factor (ECF subfamily)
MSEADGELVNRVLGGDRAAFEMLLSLHARRARAVARSVLGDDPAVDDALQEAFLRAYNHLGQLGEPRTFAAWLCTIVRNEAVSWLRRHARVRHVELTQVGDEAASVTVPTQHPAADALMQALARLPAHYREILLLKYEVNLHYDQIGESLGLSLTNVEKRLYRARQALLQIMPEFGTPPEGEQPD